MNSSRDLAIEITTGVIGANIDATMPGCGVLTSYLIQHIFNSEKQPDRKTELEKFIKQLEDSLKKYTASDGVPANWVYVKESVVPLAISTLTAFHLQNKDWLKTHKENTASIVAEIFDDLSRSNAAQYDEATLAILDIIFTAWVDSEKNSSIVITEVSRQFRQYVIENLDSLTGEVRSIAKLLADDSLLSSHASYLGTVPISTTALINARNAAVSFCGREDQIDSTLAWCVDSSSAKVACKLIHGPGGSGKTRFCMRIVSILRNELIPTEQWIAGFLDESVSLIPERLKALFRSHQRVLIVVDRAETKNQIVGELIKIATQSSQANGLTVRIILLARNYGDWWQQLSVVNDEANQVLSNSRRSALYLKPLLVEIDERVRFFQSSYNAFHKFFIDSNYVDYDLNNIVPESVLRNILIRDNFSSPLIVQMAVLQQLSHPGKLDLESLFDDALFNEKNYWKNYLDGRGAPHLLEAIPLVFALLAIFRGTDCRSNTNYLTEQALEFLGKNVTDASVIVDLLYSFYPRNPHTDRGVLPMQPDLISEYLFLDSVYKNNGLLEISEKFVFPESTSQFSVEHLILAMLNQAACSFSESGSQLLYKYLLININTHIRIAIDVARQSEGPLSHIAAKIIREMESPNLAIELVDELPEKSNALKPLAIAITERAHRRPPDYKKDSIHISKTYAMGKLNLSHRAHDIGDYVTSLESAVQSVDACAKILGCSSAPSGAMSTEFVIAIAHAWSALGRALEYIDKIHIDIRSDVFKKLPRIPLNFSLSPVMLSVANSTEHALKSSSASAQAFGELCKSYPVQFTTLHAMALIGLSNRQANFGSIADSIESIREAVKIHDDIRNGFEPWATEIQNTYYNSNRLEWDSAYASSIMHLCNRLANYLKKNNEICEEERHKLENQILAYSEEGLDIDRKNAQQEPDMYEYSLAVSLVNYSARLQEQVKFEEALRSAIEAVDVLRRLYRENYSPDNLSLLAEALKVRAQCYSSLGDCEKSIRDHNEFDMLWRQLVHK